MKKLALLLLFGYSLTLAAQPAPAIHFKSVLVDTHNDVLSSGVLEGVDISHRVSTGHSDLDRWKDGGVDIQFFSVWTGDKARTRSYYSDALQEIDSLQVLLKKNPDRIRQAFTFKDVKKGVKDQVLVALIGVEGGHMIEASLDKLDTLAQLGMRYLTLTWNNSNSWATSAMDETDTSRQWGVTGKKYFETRNREKGLTDFGRQVIKRLNELGVMVDLSHTGEKTFYDAIAATTRPVILSHSSVWNICPVFRNVKDDQIRAVARNGGVICINFYSGFISREYDKQSSWFNGPGKKAIEDSVRAVITDPGADSVNFKKAVDQAITQHLQQYRPTIAQVVDHIDYIKNLVGVDYVGIGSDFDGVNSLPVGLDDVTTYPKITEELIRRGYSDVMIEKVLGGNVLRVMKANMK